MPPMATSSSKRKWSDVFHDEEMFDKQSIMDLCTSKLRYVNPARPPRRRTEVPLLRNVLIVNTMKHLSTEMKHEKQMDYATEDLTVDPGHFEGLPPLSELLTDIMLDPQPNESSQAQGLLPFSWSSSGAANYSPLTPIEPSMPSYMDSDSALESSEEKIVHDLLPCTSVIGIDPSHHSPWEAQSDSGCLDSFLSSASLQHTSTDPLDSLASDSAFQPSSGPLPSFTSLFENSNLGSYSASVPTSSYTDLTPTASHSLSYPVAATTSTSVSSQTPMSASTEDLVGNTTLTEAELEFLAMAFSSKLPHVSFEELVLALPQSTRLQQQNPQQSSFFVPSSLQTCSGTNNSSVVEASPPTSNPCASFYRKDQPPPSVDENMVRVLVNL